MSTLNSDPVTDFKLGRGRGPNGGDGPGGFMPEDEGILDFKVTVGAVEVVVDYVLRGKRMKWSTVSDWRW